ncbi:hypothetical protein E2P81_ATG04264 [Venturia nashicola]|nr:hypothetical protein E2P81_ATG04264 [Venturia nashicola]
MSVLLNAEEAPFSLPTTTGKLAAASEVEAVEPRLSLFSVSPLPYSTGRWETGRWETGRWETWRPSWMSTGAQVLEVLSVFLRKATGMQHSDTHQKVVPFDASREIRIGGLVSDANHINPKCLDRNPLAAEFVGNPAIYCVSVLSVPLILVAASAGPPDYLSIPNEEIFAELNRAQRLELDRADWA